MSRAVRYERFGGPEVLELREVPEPHAGPGQIRVRVTAAGLNAMDPAFVATPDLAARFNVTLPSGFGYDFAGHVDEVGEGVTGFTRGERVYGGAMGRAVADFVVLDAGQPETIFRTPAGLDDEVASTLPVAGATAAAVLAALDLTETDTVLVGGAAGGVGVFAVQLAQLAGATVIGTASEGTFPFLRGLGVQPVTYGAGLEDRVRACAPGGITAAVDLIGTETIDAALALGVAPDRIAAVAAGPNPPGRARAVFGGQAQPGAVAQIAAAIVAEQLTVPIAARFPIERITEAAALQAGRHVHGKIVVTL
jgi:NADPH:quinone reductase-like Zn-dependent oxidoreductase